MFVCLFFMHSVPVRPSATKLGMAHPFVKGKAKTGSAQPKGVGGDGGSLLKHVGSKNFWIRTRPGPDELYCLYVRYNNNM